MAGGLFLDSNQARQASFFSADFGTSTLDFTGATIDGLDVADLGSGAATDGYVATADGAGGVAWEAIPSPGTQTLQQTYDGSAPATITTDATGDLTINGTEGFQVDMDKSSTINVTGAGLAVKTTTSGTLELTGAGLVDMNAGSGMDVDVTGSYDMLSTGVFSIDGTGASNVSATSGNLTLSTITSGSLVETSAADVDINAATNVTVDTTAGSISLDAQQASNFTVTGAADLTMQSTAGSVNAQGGEAAADAVRIYASNAAGGIDIDAGTGGIAEDTTGAISLAAAAASDFTVAGNLTLETTGAGITDVKSAAEVQVSTALFDANASGAVEIDGGTASHLTTATGDMTVSATAGSTNITGGEAAADAVKIEAGNVGGGIDINAGTGGITEDTTGAFSIDGAANSNVTVTGNQLQISTVTSGELDMTSAGLMDVNAGANLDMDVTGNLTVDSTGTFSLDGVGASNVTTDSGNLTISNTTSGNLIMDSAAKVTIGAANSTGVEISKTGTTTTIKGDARVNGDLVVDGTTTTVHSEEVNIADNVLYVNAGNTVSASGEAGGIVVDYKATATNTNTVGTGVFTAGVPATSNPTVTTAGSVFSAGDIIDIKGSNNNDGLYEVLTDAAGTLTIKGVGLTGTTQSFVANDFQSETNTGVTITKVNASVMESDDSGDWRMGKGSTTTGWTWNAVASATGTTLQTAYDNGPGIITDGTGNIAFSGTEGFTADMDKQSSINVTGADLLFSTTTSGELDMTSAGLTDINAGANLDVDVTGTMDFLSSGTFSIDGTGASNVSATSGNLTMSTITSGSLVATSAADVDINATTGITADGTTISIDGTDTSNFTVTGASKDLTLSSVGGSIGVTATENAVDAVNIQATTGGVQVNAAGLLNVDAGANADIDVTGSFDMLSTGVFSIDGTGASNVSATSGNLTLSTITSGTLVETSAADVDINAATNVTVDTTSGSISLDSQTASNFTVTGAADLTLNSTAGSANLQGGEAAADAVKIESTNGAGGIDMNAGTGGATLDTTGSFSIDGATGSNVSVTGAQLQISTITSGELDMTSAGLMDVNAGANLDIDVTGNTTLDSTGSTTITNGTGALKIENNAAASDIVLELGDAAGVASVSITDSASAEVASIDSNGNSSFESTTISGEVKITERGMMTIMTAGAGGSVANETCKLTGNFVATKKPGQSGENDKVNGIFLTTEIAAAPVWVYLPGSMPQVKWNSATAPTVGTPVAADGAGGVVPYDEFAVPAGKLQILGEVGSIAGWAGSGDPVTIIYNPQPVGIKI